MDGFADDILLLNLIKRGDKSAFKHLFETYFTPLCRFMYIYVHNKEVAEELALDVFLYVWEHRDTLQINLSFKAYLFQSAHNRCLNVLRQKGDVLYLEDVGDVAVDSALLNKENTEELLEHCVCISGKDDVVDAAAAGLETHHPERIGRGKTVMVRLKEGQSLDASADVDVRGVTLQQVFVALCGEEEHV